MNSSTQRCFQRWDPLAITHPVTDLYFLVYCSVSSYHSTNHLIIMIVFMVMTALLRPGCDITSPPALASSGCQKQCVDVRFGSNSSSAFQRAIARLGTTHNHREVLKCSLEEHHFPCHLNAFSIPGNFQHRFVISRNFCSYRLK